MRVDQEAKCQDLKSKELVDFLLVFKNLCVKDFFSDEMATQLLTELFFQTETVDPKILEDILDKQG